MNSWKFNSSASTILTIAIAKFLNLKNYEIYKHIHFIEKNQIIHLMDGRTIEVTFREIKNEKTTSLNSITKLQ